MIVHYTAHDENGRILFCGNCDDSVLHMAEQEAMDKGALFLTEQSDFHKDYVLNGKVMPRPTPVLDKSQIAADDADTATISGLPDPGTVIIDGETYEIAGGVLEITSPMPATYQIEVPEQFPWLPLEVEVVAA
jgi:hypothetical protein